MLPEVDLWLKLPLQFLWNETGEASDQELQLALDQVLANGGH